MKTVEEQVEELRHPLVALSEALKGCKKMWNRRESVSFSELNEQNLSEEKQQIRQVVRFLEELASIKNMPKSVRIIQMEWLCTLKPVTEHLNACCSSYVYFTNNPGALAKLLAARYL